MNKKYMIYGGIIGDMIGSIYEWKPCLKDKVKTFKLWHGNPFTYKEGQPGEGSQFTDDTVCLLAILKALITAKDSGDLEDAMICELQDLCPDYEWTGFGSAFWIWVSGRKYVPHMTDKPMPYNSYGNGSAMRVAGAALVADSLLEARHLAKVSARITHDHPEGIKGAESVASAMFLAREGKTKEEIREYISSEFGYNLHKKLDNIRPKYQFDVSCQGSVPESILCFLEGNSYEECVRLAVSLGGDADTMGCITGSIAACMYPIPKSMILQAYLRLDKRLRKIVKEWEQYTKNSNH